MRLAIVGSVELAGDQYAEKLIRGALDFYKPAVVVSGGAFGIDTMAAELARARGIQVVEHFPKERRWGGPNGYQARNLRIAQDCDRLLRIVSARSRTYGSGYTRDRAQELGKPTETYVVGSLDPERAVLVNGKLEPKPWRGGKRKATA